MKLIKKICCLSSFIFIVFTLTSCIGIGPNGIILPKKKRIYKSLNDYLEITVPKIDEVLYYYYDAIIYLHSILQVVMLYELL